MGSCIGSVISRGTSLNGIMEYIASEGQPLKDKRALTFIVKVECGQIHRVHPSAITSANEKVG